MIRKNKLHTICGPMYVCLAQNMKYAEVFSPQHTLEMISARVGKDKITFASFCSFTLAIAYKYSSTAGGTITISWQFYIIHTSKTMANSWKYKKIIVYKEQEKLLNLFHIYKQKKRKTTGDMGSQLRVEYCEYSMLLKLVQCLEWISLDMPWSRSIFMSSWWIIRIFIRVKPPHKVCLLCNYTMVIMLTSWMLCLHEPCWGLSG